MGLIFSNNLSVYASVSSYSEEQLLEVKNQYSNKNFLILGDSIGAGHLLPSQEYSYGMKLSKKLNMKYTNMAINGTTSKSLLKKLSEENYIAKIKEADIINISVGGNDVMLPALEIINNLLNSESEVSEETGNFTYSSLAENKQDLFNDLLNGKYDDRIINNLDSGMISFKENFPKILERMKQINPNCKIVLQTIYNPLSNLNLFSHVYDVIDPYISEINSLIISKAKDDNIVVSDVANYMKNENGINVANMSKMDIHPNIYGHNDIYLSLYKTLTSEYPNNIAFNLNNAECKIEYNKDNLSPTIYIYCNEGYRAPMYLDVKYNNLTALCKTQKVSDGVYSAVLPARCLYEDINVTGTCIKLSETNISDRDNTVTNGTTNKDKNNATDTITNNANSSDKTNLSKKINTYDYLYIFLFTFLIALSYVVVRIKRIKFRKE